MSVRKLRRLAYVHALCACQRHPYVESQATDSLIVVHTGVGGDVLNRISYFDLSVTDYIGQLGNSHYSYTCTHVYLL